MDPLNWEISSNNKQRQIYANLHRELTAKGLSRDQIVALGHQLDVMSPGGSFIAYLNKLRETRPSMASSDSFKPSVGLISLDESTLLSSVPRLDLSMIHSTSSPVLQLPLKKISETSTFKAVENSTLSKGKKPNTLPVIGRYQRGLPFCMDESLCKDQRSVYIENHKMTEESLNRFLDGVAASETKYRRARKARLKAKRLKKSITRLVSTKEPG